MRSPRDSVPPTEEELRLQVEKAIGALRHANAERERLLAISADAANLLDGALALQQGMRIQRQAVRALRIALARFERFEGRTRR